MSGECDIWAACYKGYCTNICQLGTPNCVDIGRDTHGVIPYP